MNENKKWEYIRDMFAFFCITIAFAVMMHYCTFCNAGKIPS